MKCSFCKGENIKQRYRVKDRMIRTESQQKFQIYQCEQCGLAFLHPQPSWKELEYFYGSDYYTNAPIGNEKRSLLYRALRTIKRKIIGPPKPKFWNFGKEKGIFLDIGCGNGAYEAYIRKTHPEWELYGIEPNTPSFQVASRIDGFKVFNGSLKDAHYSDGFFDVILMSHALEHVPDPSVVLKECFRILKCGGRLVIAVPNFNAPARRLFGGYWHHIDAPRHLFHFTKGVLTAMLKETGFSIITVKSEVLSGSIMRSAAYRLHKDKFFFDRPMISFIIYYLLFPINKLIEALRMGSGLRVIAEKK